MKQCFKCGRIKRLSSFYTHQEMADGHLGKCKDCARRDARDHRTANLEKVRAYDRQRATLPQRVALRAKIAKRWKTDPKLRQRIALQKAAWGRRNQERRAAHVLLGNALRSGRVMKPSKCATCGAKGQVHGHHEDYAAPLNVVWLCRKCHARLHVEQRNMERA